VARESPETRRERIERRRNQILNAAAEVFAERGYECARVHSVARKAGVADGTVYTYFASKRELLVGLLERLHRADSEKIRLGTRLPTDLRGFLEIYFRQRLQRLGENRDLLRVVWSQLFVDAGLRARYRREVLAPMLENSLAMFARQVAARQVGALPADTVVRAVAALVSGTMLMAVLEERPPSPELPQQLATLVVSGLSPG